jgi:hypothetical protein
MDKIQGLKDELTFNREYLEGLKMRGLERGKTEYDEILFRIRSLTKQISILEYKLGVK